MFDINKYVECVKKYDLGTYGIIVKENGKIIASHFWRKDLRHDIHSLSKSFASCAVGIAQEEGILSIHDRICDIFPEKIDDSTSSRVKKLTIENLLTMCSGHSVPYMLSAQRDIISDEWIHYFLNKPYEYDPGEHFVYDTGCTFIVSAAIQKITGMTLRDYLLPRVFDPLDIKNPQWFSSPDGINIGGAGLHLNCDEISRFAELLLNEGCYNGEQLVPKDYVKYASSKIVENGNGSTNSTCGYGLQFWRCLKEGVYRGDGAYGQLAIIFPNERISVAVTSHNEKNTEKIVETVLDCVTA